MGQQQEALKLAIKDEIFGRFRSMKARAGDALPADWLYGNLLSNMSAKEHKAFEELVSEMIREGLIEYVSGPKPTYAVTQKGLDSLC